ncbi:MAG: hypothetical protein H7098_04770 [Oligoflexus sp.]|nr:hypothetical protein [Pseudopedobacter sp.]
MELTYSKRLELLTEIKYTIQEQEIQFNNASPFYLVADQLQKFIELLPTKGCSVEFDKHIAKECKKYLNEAIAESKKDIPKSHEKEPFKTEYLDHTMRQLKDTPINCLSYIKVAYEVFCPAEMTK